MTPLGYIVLAFVAAVHLFAFSLCRAAAMEAPKQKRRMFAVGRIRPKSRVPHTPYRIAWDGWWYATTDTDSGWPVGIDGAAIAAAVNARKEAA